MTRVSAFGDAGWLVEVADVPAAHRLADTLDGALQAGDAPAQGMEITVGFGSLVVTADPVTADLDAVEAWLRGTIATATANSSGPAPGPPDRSGSSSPTAADPGPDEPPVVGSRTVLEVPVTFDGDDLEPVAEQLGLVPAGVVDLLVGSELEVAFVGFSPGFPYLVGLPEPLASLERRATPRPSVPAGSVAVAGGFAAVYPQSTPGGWLLLGRTELALFDPTTPPFARLRPGDRVRFRRREGPLDAGRAIPVARTPSTARSPGRPPLTSDGSRTVRVVEPGLFTVIQDGGRRGLGNTGVPRSGPADPHAMVLANRLVGNPDHAAAVEVTARGPTFTVDAPVHLAVVGAGAGAVDITVDGHQVGGDGVIPLVAGQQVTIGTVRFGLRAYVAMAGGIEGPMVVGSRSSDVLSGLGAGPLAAGDRLALGPPGHPHGLLVHGIHPSTDRHLWPIRAIAGPTSFAEAELEVLTATEWVVGAASNRIGLRLEGGAVVVQPPPSGSPSTGMVTGAIQIPPDGQPIVLLPDHATVGGYPVAASVITADLGLIGQVGPGDRLRFELVSVDEARSIGREHRRDMVGRISGWYPVESGT